MPYGEHKIPAWKGTTACSEVLAQAQCDTSVTHFEKSEIFSRYGRAQQFRQIDERRVEV